MYSHILKCHLLSAILLLVLGHAAHGQFITGWVQDGTSTADRVGWAAKNSGDVNADGYDDIVTIRAALLGNAARLEVLSGFDGSVIHSITTVPGGILNRNVSGAGDINNDGFADFMAQIQINPLGPNSTDDVMIFSGLDGSILGTLTASTPSPSFGISLDCAGDVDGDGTEDLIIGSPNEIVNGNRGRATVFSGSTFQPIHIFEGETAVTGIGRAVAGAGDVNADGFQDLIIGKPINEIDGIFNSGLVEVRSGLDGSILFSRDGITRGRLGQSVDGAGDVDRDGFDDFIVGEPALGTQGLGGLDKGTAYVFSGRTGNLIHSFPGATSGDAMGNQVSQCGDANGDGYSDLLASSVGPNPQNIPRVVVYSGKTGIPIFTHTGAAGSGTFQVIGDAGDVNDDGFADFVFANTFLGLNGKLRVVQARTKAVLNYTSELVHPTLLLDWLPTTGQANSLTGHLKATGGSPNAAGFFVISLAPGDNLYLGFPILVAVDTTLNLVSTGTFTFDNQGNYATQTFTRQYPSIAGSQIHIQWFERAPNPASSNGIRLVMAP